MSIRARIESNKPLKTFSTFGIGGNARYFIPIHTIEEMSSIRKYINEKKLSFLVIGKGSNALFDDRGFDGLVILNKIDFLEFEEGELHVGAGYSFSLLGTQISRKGWGGLEFASGIPGSVGGAIYMNAGAGGWETCDTLTAVCTINSEGNLIERKKENLSFTYRTSPFQFLDEIIISGKFRVKKEEKAKEKQRKILEHRMESQPYSEKSVGCIFRNPKGQGAGALIEACGLKGKRIGGAEVSTLHGNFIVNRGGAKAHDVLALANLIKKTIREKKGVELEMEVRSISYQLKEN